MSTSIETAYYRSQTAKVSADGAKVQQLLLVSVIAILVAQDGAQRPSEPPAVAAPTKFDVASIRSSSDRSDQEGVWMGIGMTGGTFEVHSMPLKALVVFAYASGSLSRLSSFGSKMRDQALLWDRKSEARKHDERRNITKIVS